MSGPVCRGLYSFDIYGAFGLVRLQRLDLPDIISRFAARPSSRVAANGLPRHAHAHVRLSMCFLWSSVGSHSKDQ